MNRMQEQEETKKVEEEEQKTSNEYTPADREYYLINMPLKTAAKERSNRRLEENKFMLGAGYFDLVEESKMGIKTLEELLQKFPNSGYKLQAYYYLYRMNMVLNNEAGKQKYRNLLLSEFPNSEQTKQITDPNYYNMAKENTAKAERLYQYTFEAYTEGYYEAVIENVKDAEKRYPGNALMPKFKYLEIMATGSEKGVDTIIENLEQYIKTYPSEKELIKLARTTIENLRNVKSTPENVAAMSEIHPQQTIKREEDVRAKEPEIDISMFKENIAAPHYCLLFLNIPEVNTSIITIRLSDFNRMRYGQDSLKFNGIGWDEDYHLVYVHTLKTASVAKGYMEELQNSRYVWGTVPKEFYQIMLISDENFVTLMNLRNKDTYRHFFEKHYNP